MNIRISEAVFFPFSLFFFFFSPSLRGSYSILSLFFLISSCGFVCWFPFVSFVVTPLGLRGAHPDLGIGGRGKGAPAGGSTKNIRGLKRPQLGHGDTAPHRPEGAAAPHRVAAHRRSHQRGVTRSKIKAAPDVQVPDRREALSRCTARHASTTEVRHVVDQRVRSGRDRPKAVFFAESPVSCFTVAVARELRNS